MGKFVSNVKEFFDFCDKNEVVFVDFRFTDMKGTWHHLSYNYKRLDKDFVDGIPFDGSSVEAWQPINKSDMILKPDIDIFLHFPYSRPKCLFRYLPLHRSWVLFLLPLTMY